MGSRELDAEVAEKVMGYSEPITVYQWRDRKKKESPRVMFKVGPKGAWGGYKTFSDSDGNKIDQLHEIRCYSTDISAAFQVVEKMRERDWYLCLEAYESSYRAWFSDGDDEKHGLTRAHDAPEAICRAALAAIGARGKA